MFQKLADKWLDGYHDYVIDELLLMPKCMVARFIMIVIQFHHFNNYDIDLILSKLDKKDKELDSYAK